MFESNSERYCFHVQKSFEISIFFIFQTESKSLIHFYNTDKFILQNLLTKGEWCLSKSKFPVCANFIQLTKKY